MKIRLDKTAPVKDGHRNVLKQYVQKCGVPETINLDDVEFRWSFQLQEYGYDGAFDPSHPNVVFLCPPCIGSIGRNIPKRMLKEMAPIVAHELEHMRKWQELPAWKWALYSHIPFVNFNVFEKPAIKKAAHAAKKLKLDPAIYGGSYATA